MILIADSGGSKTDWRIIDENGTVDQARTSGLNPFYKDRETIALEIKSSLQSIVSNKVDHIYFYGAGCSTEHNCNVISNSLSPLFPNASISVDHDLLGAARALCNREAGIACILGTGSNSCLYDGNEIIDNIPPLGYILGDEGSGSHMGKALLADFVRDEIPTHLKDALINQFKISRETILESVYQNPNPIQFLAGFAKFISSNLKEQYIYDMVYNSFEMFFEKNIFKYPDYNVYKVHFCGAVAFYFNSLIRKVASDKDITVGNIIESPIAGLTVYHNKGLDH